MNKLKIMDEKKYYTYDFWFNNPDHIEWDHGKDKYYVHTFYDNIVKKLPIPEEGKILIMGTHNCHSFDKLCKHFGYNRCLGFDLHNPTKHPNVIIKNCMELNEQDDMDIAFCHNDLGNYATTPKLKEHAQEWAARNIVKGGYMLSNNNYNRGKIDNIKIMMENKCKITQLAEVITKYNLSSLPFKRIEGYMLSKKL